MPLRNKNSDAERLSDYSLHTENPSKGKELSYGKEILHEGAVF